MCGPNEQTDYVCSKASRKFYFLFFEWPIPKRGIGKGRKEYVRSGYRVVSAIWGAPPREKRSRLVGPRLLRIRHKICCVGERWTPNRSKIFTNVAINAAIYLNAKILKAQKEKKNPANSLS